MSVEEIYEFVDSTLHLTFDFMASVLVASMIIGLNLFRAFSDFAYSCQSNIE